MAPSRRIAALVAVTALAFTACSSNDADAGDIEEAMLDAGLSDEQASCMAEQLDGELDQGQLNDLASASNPDEFGELEEVVTAAVDECVAPGGSGSGESSESSESTDSTGSTEGSDEGGEPSDSTEADGEPSDSTEGSDADTTATTAG